MAAKKTERLLNLVICLLATRRYLSVQQVREAVPGYQQQSDEAFRRMFERDKEELRDLGIPLETGTDSPAHDDEPGYRIARRAYELPEITLAPDEAAVLGLAARLWQSAPLAGATASGLLKLRAAGVDAPAPPAALEPRIAASEPAFTTCWEAVRDGRVLTFDYRTAGRTPAGDLPDVEVREVEPWGVVSWRGRWYLVGRDRARRAERVFRLSRIVGVATMIGAAGAVTPPAGHQLRATVARFAGDEPRFTATVRLRSGTGWALRQRATSIAAEEPGWDVVTVAFSDVERFADRVAGFGADAVLLTPPEARAAVIRRLRALAGTPA